MDIITKSYLYQDERYTFLKITGQNDVIKSTSNREIILVIDVSGSMKSIINTVKLSLKSFRDVINREIKTLEKDIEMKQMGLNKDNQKPEDDDNQKPDETIPISLITFNDKATIFDDDIDTLTTGGKTNISKAVNLAFSIESVNKMTWIILFSDGQPNNGILTEEGFRNLASMKPKRTKIVCAGFKKDSSCNILSALGDFSFIDNETDIDPFFKSVAFEIITATYVNFSCSNIITDDMCDYNELTSIPDIRSKLSLSCINFSGVFPDVIYTGSTFSCVFKSNDNNTKFEYTILENNEVVSETIETKYGEIDDEIRSTMNAQNVQNILIQMKEVYNLVSTREFSKYKKMTMGIMLRLNDRNSMIKVQVAFDLIGNAHEYEHMLTVEKTQSHVNNSQNEFIRRTSTLPPKYKSSESSSANPLLVRAFSGIS